MFEFQLKDNSSTNMRVSGNFTTDAETRELVEGYMAFFAPIRTMQVVYVIIDEGTNITFEQMFKVFTGIKMFHVKHKLIESVNIYMSDKHIAQCCRCLMNLFSPSVKINILLKEV
jgi:hypothetical protein